MFLKLTYLIFLKCRVGRHNPICGGVMVSMPVTITPSMLEFVRLFVRQECQESVEHMINNFKYGSLKHFKTTVK